jgi:hypothetical protein
MHARMQAGLKDAIEEIGLLKSKLSNGRWEQAKGAACNTAAGPGAGTWCRHLGSGMSGLREKSVCGLLACWLVSSSLQARSYVPKCQTPNGSSVTDRANGGLAGVGVSGGGDLLGSVTGNTSLLRGRAIESLSRVGKMSVSRRDEDAR